MTPRNFLALGFSLIFSPYYPYLYLLPLSQLVRELYRKHFTLPRPLLLSLIYFSISFIIGTLTVGISYSFPQYCTYIAVCSTIFLLLQPIKPLDAKRVLYLCISLYILLAIIQYLDFFTSLILGNPIIRQGLRDLSELDYASSYADATIYYRTGGLLGPNLFGQISTNFSLLSLSPLFAISPHYRLLLFVISTLSVFISGSQSAFIFFVTSIFAPLSIYLSTSLFARGRLPISSPVLIFLLTIVLIAASLPFLSVDVLQSSGRIAEISISTLDVSQYIQKSLARLSPLITSMQDLDAATLFFGRGLGSWYSYSVSSGNLEFSNAHNCYFQFFYEGGLMGLLFIAYILFRIYTLYYYSIKQLTSNSSSINKLRSVYPLLIISFTLIGAFFHDILPNPSLYLFSLPVFRSFFF